MPHRRRLDGSRAGSSPRSRCRSALPSSSGSRISMRSSGSSDLVEGCDGPSACARRCPRAHRLRSGARSVGDRRAPRRACRASPCVSANSSSSCARRRARPSRRRCADEAARAAPCSCSYALPKLVALAVDARATAPRAPRQRASSSRSRAARASAAAGQRTLGHVGSISKTATIALSIPRRASTRSLRSHFFSLNAPNASTGARPRCRRAALRASRRRSPRRASARRRLRADGTFRDRAACRRCTSRSRRRTGPSAASRRRPKNTKSAPLRAS